jgi:hypothetical protein
VFSKNIDYEDFNGVMQTKTFYFHLSKAKLLEMSADGDMVERIDRITKSKDNLAILKEFKELVKMSVGLKSDDGQSFIQTDEVVNALVSSPAYDELLLELSTDATSATEFVTNLLPKKMQDEMLAKLKSQKDGPDPFKETEDTRPAWMREHRNPTPEELRNMSTEELQLAFQHRK